MPSDPAPRCAAHPPIARSMRKQRAPDDTRPGELYEASGGTRRAWTGSGAPSPRRVPDLQRLMATKLFLVPHMMLL